ncbi:hypothetical protein HOC01_02295 [archaeon]|jgi:hypothetical protein|nr:hypothetical protein [archaeon]MBT6697851.1 hypothetical protein [archaeon]
MPITFEAILYYLIIIDSLTYTLLTFTKGKLHDKVTHWPIMKSLPLKPLFAFLYLGLVFWIGLALYRLGIIF